MKTVPILVVTNALALGLIILLYVQHEDLKSQMGSSRNGATRRDEVPVDSAELQDRIARLEARYGAAESVATEKAEEARVGEEGGEPAAAEGRTPGVEELLADGGMDELLKMSPAEMESFRAKVRVALQMNAREDRLRDVMRRIDRLVEQNRISPLNDDQKKRVGEVFETMRRSGGDVWRRVRENNDLSNMDWSERMQLFQAEYDSLRVEAQKSLEEVLPAADAKLITEEAMRGGGRGGMRGMWSGGSSRRTPRAPGGGERRGR